VGFFRNVKGVTVLSNTDVTRIDRGARKVAISDAMTGLESLLEYDRLVIASGSSPIVPPIDNVDLVNIFTVKSIEDAERLKMLAVKDARACIVGAGLIGMEIAESLRKIGVKVTVVEMRSQVLPGILDPEMAALVEKEVEKQGVTLRLNSTVSGFKGRNIVEAVIIGEELLAVDIVVLAPGVRPNVSLARDAGLEIGTTGAIAVDERLCTSDPDIYACGDCCESVNRITGKKVYVPLGSTANKQGRVVGINAAGGDAVFQGIIGTAILRFFDVNAGKTGLTETEARANGYDVETLLSPAHDKPHFFPDAKLIVLKMVADKKSGKILGVQVVGAGVVDKRLDVAATAISFGATAEQLSQLDLAYAPPFSAAMDNLIVAADIMKNKLAGIAIGVSPQQVKQKLDAGDDFVFLDVRSPAEFDEIGIDGATLIPLGMLRQRLSELPKEKEIIAFCKISLRGYEAQKIMQAAGFPNVKFMDGGIMAWPYELSVKVDPDAVQLDLG
jgi:NADPH-dependent 2,4-dienoyl-CoA reductase/sulfur reductase-like enzyme/rhodanese-related sulfurtransferase